MLDDLLNPVSHIHSRYSSPVVLTECCAIGVCHSRDPTKGVVSVSCSHAGALFRGAPSVSLISKALKLQQASSVVAIVNLIPRVGGLSVVDRDSALPPVGIHQGVRISVRPGAPALVDLGIRCTVSDRNGTAVWQCSSSWPKNSIILRDLQSLPGVHPHRGQQRAGLWIVAS